MPNISLNIIQEQYSRMSDTELQNFAVNEHGSLTMESFHLLIDEFAKRNLDLGIIEDAKIDRALSELTSQTAFEEKTAKDFEMSLMMFVFDQKEKGISNSKVFKALLARGLNENYAQMFIQSLPWKVQVILDELHTNRIIGWIFSAVGFLLIMLWMNDTGARLIIYGLFLSIAGAVTLIINYSKQEKYQQILKNLNEDGGSDISLETNHTSV